VTSLDFVPDLPLSLQSHTDESVRRKERNGERREKELLRKEEKRMLGE
jgi:hypothetical protein